MKLSKESQTNIEAAVRKALNTYKSDSEQTEITDIYMQPWQSTGKFLIFDDDDKILADTLVKEWIAYEGNSFYEHVERILRPIITKMKDAGDLKNLSILPPYSFVLADEDKETLSEIILIDEDTLLLNNELLQGLDDELDDFLRGLLAD